MQNRETKCPYVKSQKYYNCVNDLKQNYKHYDPIKKDLKFKFFLSEVDLG